MATYAFEVMSPEQAAAFGLSDSLVIVGASAVGVGAVSVSYVGSTVTIGYLGRTLTFGASFTSQVHSIRPGAEPAIIIGSTGDDMLTGRDNPSGLALPGGEPVADRLFGGPGADTIDSGAGQDTVSGGAGADLFVFRSLQTGTGEVVTDFEAIDRIALDILPTSQTYLELVASGVNAGNSAAQAEINSQRADVVAVQVGADVYLYADATGRNSLSNVVRLVNTSLSQIDLTTFVAAPAVRAPTPASPGLVDAPPPPSIEAPAKIPAAPTIVGLIRGVGTVTGNMDDIHFGQLRDAAIRERTDADLSLAGGGANLRLHGSVLVYDANKQLIEGQAHSLNYTSTGIVPLSLDLVINGLGQRVAAFSHWVGDDASQEALNSFLSGNDNLTGSAGADLIRGYTGHDVISARGGRDTVFGGAGDDVIYARQQPGATASEGVGDTYLRGDEGDDWIVGGLGFDDINGNTGNDTAAGGAGADWVVGGKDNDLLFGEDGGDLVYGNLGNDTCEGGEGNDTILGGQDNDIVRGGSGNDYISGDRGSDTMSGGAGADIFHTFSTAGEDVVTDFIYGEGDRVMLDPRTQYTVTQSGLDVVITMSSGRMVLQNVLLSTLGSDWIYGA